MASNYALFIIIVPNDFDRENSIVPLAPTGNIIKSETTPASIDTVSALVSLAAIPLPIQPAITPFIKTNTENDLTLVHERSSIQSVCVLLRNYLTERSDIEALWLISDNKISFQVTFYVEFGFDSDRMLQDLTEVGVGRREGTKIFVLPTIVVLQEHNNEKPGSPSSSFDSTEDINNLSRDKIPTINVEAETNPAIDSPTTDISVSRKILKRINESNFKKSVRARLMVHQVVASIRASSAITFDFVLLICLASMLAAFGLLESSTVVIVASMLVSPLMNPILGIVFGLSVRDHSLWRRGLQNEIIGLIICITCGFFLGLFTTYFETAWGSSTSFPTSEMKSRGDVKRLWVGVLIALPSGAGVALSVLGGNTGSLVGVAISASLLPPAVNCGLLFAYAVLGNIFSTVSALQLSTSNGTNDEYFPSRNCTKYINNDYSPLYTCHLATEAAILALCSLLLTIVNIICIIIMALIILRIKEVVPLHQPNNDIANFFHHDVKVARDYNKTIHQGDFNPKDLTPLTPRRNHLAQNIVNRWKTFKPSTTQQPSAVSPSPKNNDLESSNQQNNLSTNDLESRRKLYRLKSFAKEYDLDIFNKDDYKLTNRDSREKARLLVTDLIDMCQEIPAIFVDLYRLQPTGTHTSSADKEHISFYQEIIEILPPNWYQLFIYERQRRHITSWPLTFNRSYSMRSHPLETHGNSAADSNNPIRHPSLTKKDKKSRTWLARQTSVPNSAHQETEIPVEGTRFRISQTSDTFANGSKLI